jgi:type I restriction enzyme S subunit
MKLETFFEKFDQFAEAPNAVAKMRELVLGLAVRGKLVEQHPNDEPASELLKQIYAAKSDRRFCDESGEDPTASSDHYPFVIPKSWQWVGATTPAVIISDLGKKVQTKEILPEGAYPVVDQGKVFIRGYYDDPEKVIKVTEPIVLFGDHTRETKLIDFDFVVGADGVKLLQPLCIDPFYYFLALRWLPLDSRGYGRHFKLLRASVIPLPPLAEQKRIVTKVDELIALCDRLDTQQKERNTRHAALAHASLTRFADAPTPANLNLLFHPSYAVAPPDLRKAILSLAVQGKLVSQDVDDEPASILLSQIAEEKRRLVSAGEIRRQDGAAPISEDEMPFDVPTGWQWARLSAITRRIHYGFTASAKSEINHVRLLRITDIQNNAVDWPSVPGCEILDKDIPQYQLERGDILVARTGGTVGKTYLVRDIPVVAVFASYLIRIQGALNFFDQYLKLFLESPSYWVQLEAGARGGAQPNVNGQTLGRMIVTIPPLAEQRRIVAKVDQLMALVDQLEIQLTASRATATNLMGAVVAELTAQE